LYLTVIYMYLYYLNLLVDRTILYERSMGNG